MVFKRRQVVVLSLVLMIVVAGYLQYSYKRGSSTIGSKDNSRLGEAVYVDSMGVIESTAQKDKKDSKVSPASASKQANDFFTQAKIDRETAVSRDSESLKKITVDINASKDVKAKAYDQMTNLVSLSQREMKIETLVKEKGFIDVIALFGDDGSIDIVVKAPELTSAQVAQITDVASRQANVQISKIHIKNMY